MFYIFLDFFFRKSSNEKNCWNIKSFSCFYLKIKIENLQNFCNFFSTKMYGKLYSNFKDLICLSKKVTIFSLENPQSKANKNLNSPFLFPDFSCQFSDPLALVFLHHQKKPSKCIKENKAKEKIREKNTFFWPLWIKVHLFSIFRTSSSRPSRIWWNPQIMHNRKSSKFDWTSTLCYNSKKTASCASIYKWFSCC